MLSFTIVVTEANARVRPIHDRMPVEITRKNVTSFARKFGDYSGYLDAIGPEEREIADRLWKLRRRAATATGIATCQNAAAIGGSPMAAYGYER